MPGRWASIAKSVAVLATLIGGSWILIGERTWRDIRELRAAELAAEESAPIGYVGLYFRKNYAARPSKFLFEESGKTLLFAALGEDPGDLPSFYDVTNAALDLTKLWGGVGRDSIAGVDYPIHQTRFGDIGQNFRRNHEMFTFRFDEGPRAYPRWILERINVINDSDNSDPFVLVYDHAKKTPLCYSRILNGEAVTFGTTGYNVGGSALLYDRVSHSLWLPTNQGLTSVNGRHNGKILPQSRSLTSSTWGDWTRRYPKSLVLVGSDRSLPIPTK